ncbi:hypothetical protein B4089_3745 [Bacillus licheniformis]|nr:hypothetical protein B4089_3594 [Bacillus licheniformis]OLF87275.1 hypothetical protein B4089_3745 [Bacillus licheniformis]
MKKVKAYLLENMEELQNVVREINTWDGSLEHLDYEYNDEEFFNVFFEGKPMEAVRAVFYGDYRYMDDYVKFDGYGNLESASEYQVEKELEESIDEIMDALEINFHNLRLSDELTALINGEKEKEEE